MRAVSSKGPLRPATMGVQSPTPTAAHAFVIGDEHHLDISFAMRFEWPGTWLDSGSELVRAARAIARQSAIDAGTFRTWIALPAEVQGTVAMPHRARITMQAAFLGALAVENGLKGLFVAKQMAIEPRSPVASPPTARLPKELVQHDLEELSIIAAFDTSDPADREALAAGKSITEGFGRYPTMTSAKTTPTTYNMSIQATFDAFERLFFKCVDEVARALHPRFCVGNTPDKFAAEWVMRYEQACDGVSPPWSGEERVALFNDLVMTPVKRA